MIRIADSSILLRKVSGFSVVIKAANGQVGGQWKLTSAQISGQFTKVNTDSAKPQSESLFGQEEIPSCYYRSCLLSPKFFPVINKQIASIVSDPAFARRLRIRVMNFFKNIMRLDQELAPIIFAEIDLSRFLQTNIVGQDNGCIQVACDFLHSFQHEPKFAASLYEILIQNF